MVERLVRVVILAVRLFRFHSQILASVLPVLHPVRVPPGLLFSYPERQRSPDSALCALYGATPCSDFHFPCSMLGGGKGTVCSLWHEPLVNSGTIRAANVAITAIITGLSQKGSSRGIPCLGSLYSIIFLLSERHASPSARPLAGEP